MTREANRAAMPLVTEMVDMIRASYPDAKVLWVKEGDREMGKRPELAPDEFEIDGSTLERLAEHTAAFGRKKR